MSATIFSYAGQSNIVGLRSFLEYIPSFGLDSAIPLVRDGAVSPLGPWLVPDPENDNGFREGGFVPEGQASVGYCVEVFLSHIFDAPDNEVVALKNAKGGTSLAVNWNPDRPGTSWKQLTRDTAVAKEEALKLDDDVRMGPLIWWHGETDSTVPEYAATYGENLENFVVKYREMVGDPEARIVLVMTVTGGGGEKRRQVQTAQREMADKDPNILLYDPSHLARYPDNLHFTQDYSIQAAAEIANMMVAEGWARTSNRWGSAASERITGDGAGQFLWGLAGDDTLRGMGGDDTLAGDLGADALDGGDGEDTAIYDAATGGVRVNLASGTGHGNIAEGDTLTAVEHLQGGSGADTLIGDGADNRLQGGGGADRLSGGDGDDTLAGGAGNDSASGDRGADYLLGGDGDDTLSGGAGEDRLLGGAGEDNLSGGPGADHLNGQEGNDRLLGGPGDDLILGGEGDDVLTGGKGKDALHGGAGNDIYIVGAGDVITESAAASGGWDSVRSAVDWKLAGGLEGLRLTGSDPVSGTGNGIGNVLTGNGAANRLAGVGGADTLSGGGGADTLIGGQGQDLLRGGEGADVFLFGRTLHSTPARPDTIMDFSAPGEKAGDLIDLSGIDANTGRSGIQHFAFGSLGAGGLSLVDQGADTLVRGNVDGDRDFEFAVLIRDGATPASAYSAEDFLL